MREILIIEEIIVLGEGYNLEDFRSKAKFRGEGYVITRHLVMTICSLLTDCSLSQIGSLYGKDHASVLHSKKVVQSLCESKSVFNDNYKKYLKRCKLALISNKQMQPVILKKVYDQLPKEIVIKTDDGIDIVYKLAMVDNVILGKQVLNSDIF